jgi:ribosomal-protein-alanine N-acetyltransferase
MLTHVIIRTPTLRDETAFLQAVLRSRALHRGWVSPSSTSEQFRKLLERRRGDTHQVLLVWLRMPRALVGVINLSEIVRASFQSAYLGYYAFEPYAGKGLMREGMALAIAHAFDKIRLHRLEANIQPNNMRSKSLVHSLGFRHEGFSPRYLKIGGRWRDHERWALLAEDWAAFKRTKEPER